MIFFFSQHCFSNIQINTEDIWGLWNYKKIKYIDRTHQNEINAESTEKNLGKCHSLPLLQLHLRWNSKKNRSQIVLETTPLVEFNFNKDKCRGEGICKASSKLKHSFRLCV